MTSFEMTGLKKDKHDALSSEELSGRAINPVAPGAQVSSIQVWAFAVAILMLILTVPLLFFPRFLIFLSDAPTNLTPLERFLSNQIGILLLALAAGCIMATPDTSIAPSATNSSNPLLVPMTVAAAVSALMAWNAGEIGSLGTLVCFGNGTIAAWGFWTMLFAGSFSTSKKTGADKRTSTYFFANKAAARAQKNEWKEHQRNR